MVGRSCGIDFSLCKVEKKSLTRPFSTSHVCGGPWSKPEKKSFKMEEIKKKKGKLQKISQMTFLF